MQTVKFAGEARSENAGMSSESPDENSGCRKSKVSSAMSISWGLVGSNLVLYIMARDVQTVNIRLLIFTRYYVFNDEVC